MASGPELALRGDKLVEKHRLHGDTSDMGAQGFAFHREKGFWSEFGGFAKYLNLEYYPGPLGRGRPGAGALEPSS